MLEGRGARETETVFFRTRFQPRCHPKCGLMEPIPLINVALLVLLFFLVAPRLLTRPGVAIEPPVAAFRDGAPYEALALGMDGQGRLFSEDAPLAPGALPALLSQAAADNPSVLLLETDRHASYEQVMRVYDQAVAAGVDRVILAVRPLVAPGPLP